ncbi:hypothetical protein L207DRAFT_511968 [Hyaloscypha variabilis F]|uniref:Uncharacterized protein n=1 Tax=Hyaloscypha variabilis (strain UAMH 11265 / GT02V1 / F) TaxID=1149755 RepID=A0A2J6RPP6_HYAVF|nr:hypothetical protein L207DRAFT_511968 [Hyaloscypha variabilis F]
MKIKALPHLAAVINEGCRLHSGTVSRSQRIGREPLTFNDWVIPASTPINSSSYFTHYNETLFAQPCAFIPDR